MKRPPPGATNRVDLNKAVTAIGTLREEEFWAKVDHGDPAVCWPWKGAKLPKGYGLFGIGKGCRSSLAHRVAYIIGNGLIPRGLIVRHSCHNPSCCNPNHLICGTYAENAADKKRKIVFIPAQQDAR